MDKCSSDADFDSYWEYESRNKNRNRIRVGRQYQASVPPLLKPGEKDTRRCEDLETLKWKPDKLSDHCVDQYLSMAKAISRFARAIDPSLVPEKAIDTPMQTALKGLSEFVTSHHPYHHDDGCQVPNPQLSGECSTKHASSSEWTPNEAQLFAQALEVCGKNFCAIKKDFLPWKPVRSIIEYYYQGKSEKATSPNPVDPPSEELDNKVEKVEPVASCSEDSPNEQVLQPKVETKELSDACLEDCKIEVPEEVPFMQSLKVEESEEKAEEMKPTDSSTVGSLKFYLGGRLVLKLNAQQYSDSGSKCHWVPSNDTPKRPQLIKRVKHKKKMYQESSSAGYQMHPGKPENQSWDSPDVTECDVVIAKKAKLKSDCESSSETETSCPLLYSTSWTPPVANGPDVVEMDDGSSKTSEGCISPVQASSLGETSDIKCEVSASAVNSSAAAGNFCDPSEISEVKPQHERMRVKTEPFPGSCSASQSETCLNDSNTIQGAHLKTEKSMPNQVIDDSFSQEVRNNQMCTKNVCSTDTNNALSFLPRSAVSCSPSKKHWYRWATSPCADSFESSKVHSPNSISQTPVARQAVEDSPLDLSSKSEDMLQENVVENTVPSASKVAVNFQREKGCPSPLKEEEHLVCNKSKEGGINVPLSSSDSVDEDTKVRTCALKTEENKISVSESGSVENSEKCTKSEDSISSLPVKNLDEKNKNSSDFSYPYYNIPCSCSSPKCTSSFALKEHMCNKDGIECLKSHSDYLLPVSDRTASGKPPPWYEASVATYLQYYPQCYPYYLAYGVAPSSCTGSSVGELPLDLSSTCENSKEENVQHNVPEKETSVTPSSAEALEKGMLYHLLKNRNSK